MKNKICVYAICKNEEKFVDTWLESMKEADYIVILDTGSEDKTYEMISTDERVYQYKQQIIDPWRFDTARNLALELVPEDANILVSTDLDEVFEPGWADILRQNWIDGEHVRAIYKYAWSHNESGEPARIFMYDKIHSRNWIWKAPVHEYLVSDKYDDNYVDNHTLQLFDDGVYLHHYQDKSKSRSSYLPLLELRAKEDPDDYYGLYYYAHELYYQGKYQESIKILDMILNNDRFADRRTILETAACYLFIGDSLFALESCDMAITAYQAAIFTDPTYREPYLRMANVYMAADYFDMAIGIVQESFRKSYRHYTWLERDTSWREEPYDILCVSYYYTDQYEKSYINAMKALAYNPTDERLVKNAALALDKIK